MWGLSNLHADRGFLFFFFWSISWIFLSFLQASSWFHPFSLWILSFPQFEHAAPLRCTKPILLHFSAFSKNSLHSWLSDTFPLSPVSAVLRRTLPCFCEGLRRQQCSEGRVPYDLLLSEVKVHFSWIPCYPVAFLTPIFHVPNRSSICMPGCPFHCV